MANQFSKVERDNLITNEILSGVDRKIVAEKYGVHKGTLGYVVINTCRKRNPKKIKEMENEWMPREVPCVARLVELSEHFQDATP